MILSSLNVFTVFIKGKDNLQTMHLTCSLLRQAAGHNAAKHHH